MPRFALIVVALIALLASPSVFGQAVVAKARNDETSLPLPVPLVSASEGEPAQAPDEPLPPDTPAIIDTSEVEGPCPDLLHEFWGYRYSRCTTSWIVGDGDRFGMVSLVNDHFKSRGEDGGLGLGAKIHFLAGPERTDMPPHVFDFSVAWQRRHRAGNFGYDVAVSVMASSDFEGSSREGIRFPGHAVCYLQVNPAWEIVFGVDYLDRSDIKLLPVAGVILLPHPDIRLELVFPRPRIVLQLSGKHRLSIAGEMGGGTWAIERTTLVDDLATYRDLRLSVGLEHAEEDGQRSTFEIAYLFDRKLEYTSGIGDYWPRDSVMILSTQTY